MSTDYDPQVIRAYADKLYLEATRAPVTYGVAAAVVAITAGLGFGLGLDSVPAGVTVGALLGLASGWVGVTAGRSAAARMRLSAQQALCQVQIERRLKELNGKDD